MTATRSNSRIKEVKSSLREENDCLVTSEDFDQKRLQDLRDNIEKDQELLKEYEDSLRYETEPRRKKQYEQDIERLHQSITKYKREYTQLKERINRIARISGYTSISLKNQALPKQPPLLFNLLLQIDFQQQLELVEIAVSKYQTIGFLIHGAPECGQEILVNQIYRIKTNWRKDNPISINVSQKGVGNNVGNLWVRVARSLELPMNVKPNKILERICDRLKTQNVIFIFSSVDYMPTKILDLWLQEFWKPLVAMAITIQPLKKKETHLLMFLVDYRGSICQSEVNLAEECESSRRYDPCIPLRLPPASPFTLEMLEDWIKFANRFSSEFTIPEGLTAQILYENSRNGIPEYVVETICKHCGLSWEGGLAKWLI